MGCLLPAGTRRNEPSGDQANLLKKDGSVSSWKRWFLADCINITYANSSTSNIKLKKEEKNYVAKDLFLTLDSSTTCGSTFARTC